MTYERRDIVGGAIVTTLASSLLSGASSTTITATTGWPAGTNGKFFCIVDEGQSGEEKILVTTRAGANLTGISRGQDGTTQTDHQTNAVIRPCLTARDLDEANYAVSKLIAAGTTKGDLLPFASANTPARLAAGADNQLLIADASQPTGLRWGIITLAAQLGTGVVGTATIADGTVTSTELSADQVWAPGDLKVSARATITGWLLCDGAAVSRTTYANLFTEIGTKYGVGNGTTTFNVPDYRDKVIMGASGTKALGSTGGADTVTISTAQMPSHTHIQDPHTHVQDPHTHTQNAHNHSQNAHQHLASGAGVLVAPGLNATLQIQGSGGFINTTIASAFDTGLQTATNNPATATTQNQTATNQNATATNQTAGGGAPVTTVPSYGTANVFIKT